MSRHRYSRRVARCLFACVLTFAITACSGGARPEITTVTSTSISMPTTVSTSPPAESGEWRPTTIEGTILGFVEFGGTAAMLLVDEDDRLTLLRLTERGWEPVTSDPVKVTNLRRVEWGPVASDGERIVLALTGLERDGPGGDGNRLLQTITTIDGEIFTAQAERGFRVTDIAYDEGRWVAVGEQIDAGIPPTPIVWLSGDGVSWDRPLVDELLRNDLRLISVTAGGGRIVALAHNTWRPIALSTSDGVDWHLVPLERGPDSSRIDFVDGRFEFGDLDGGLESEDGVVWKAFESLSGTADAATWGDGTSNHFDGFRVVTPIPVAGSLLTAGTSTHKTSSLYCYDDLATCHEAFLAMWVRTDRTWRRLELDLPGPPINSWGSTSGFIVEEVAYAAETLILKTNSREEGEGWVREVWNWHHGDNTALPDEAPPLDTSPPVARYAIPDHDEPLELGVEYAIPISAFCDLRHLSNLGTFGGVVWRSSDIGQRIDPSWPSRTITYPSVGRGSIVFGVAERVSESIVEYRIPGAGTIATYQPGTEEGLSFCA